jgi:hypothetical protein
MPYHKVKNSSQCPKKGQIAVIKDGTSDVMGCHDTEAGADRQLAALYAREPEAKG